MVRFVKSPYRWILSLFEKAFRTALSFGRLFQAEVLIRHVVERKSVDALNRLGLAVPSEATKQKK
jgi:hypothetical protein